MALLARVLRVFEARGSFGAADPAFRHHVLDAAFYDEMARRVLAGTDHGPYLMAPLYGWFLAGVYAVGERLGLAAGDPTLVCLVQATLGSGTALIAACIAGELAPAAHARLAAWVGGLAVALYPAAIIFDARLLSVGLSTFLTAAVALLLMRVWRGLRPAAALLAGLLLGLTTLARANLLLVAPLLVLALLWVGWQRQRARGLLPALLLLVGFAAPLAPVARFNHNAGGGYAPVSVNGGVNLYRGNNPWVVSEAVNPFRLPGAKDALANRTRLIASLDAAMLEGGGGLDGGRLLSWPEADAAWTGRAVGHWREDPLRYLGLFLRKTAQVLGPVEIGDNVDTPDLRRGSVFLRYLPNLWLAIATLGAIWLWRRLWAARRGAADDPALPVAIVAAVGVASVALFFVVDRYRIPLLPLFAAGAGALVAELRGGVVARGRTVLAGGALALLVSLPPTTRWLPWSLLAEGLGQAEEPPACLFDVHVLRDPAIEAQFRVAAAHLIAGQKVEAEKKFRQVLLLDPGHIPAMIDLSGLLLERRSWQEAGRFAARAIDHDSCDDKAWANLGVALSHQNLPELAAKALERAMQLDPYEPGYWTRMADLELLQGNAAAARVLLRRGARWQPDDWRAVAALARFELGQKRYADAELLFGTAQQLAPERAELWALRGLARVGQGDRAGAAQLRDDAVAAGLHDPLLDQLDRVLKAPLSPAR